MKDEEKKWNEKKKKCYSRRRRRDCECCCCCRRCYCCLLALSSSSPSSLMAPRVAGARDELMKFTLSSIARSARARTHRTASAPARKTCGLRVWVYNCVCVCVCYCLRVCKGGRQMTGSDSDRDRDETNQMALRQGKCMLVQQQYFCTVMAGTPHTHSHTHTLLHYALCVK